MNSAILIVALSTGAVVLVFVLFGLPQKAGRTTAEAGQGRRRKVPRDRRRWLFGEHNIPLVRSPRLLRQLRALKKHVEMV